MWAVLGLVSMDVTSIAVKGVVDGQHVAPTMPIVVTASDNQAGGVRKLELLVDDRPLTGACAARLETAWKTDGLAEGKHTLDVVATNEKGQVSRRRYEVYAGNVILTELGSRYDEAKMTTEIAVRNIAPTPAQAGKVELNVYAAEGAENKRGAKVWSTDQAGAPGAMTFRWDGTGSDGKPRPRGRYIAELVLRDAKNDVVQKTETMFLQDSEAAQRAGYGEIEGQLVDRRRRRLGQHRRRARRRQGSGRPAREHHRARATTGSRTSPAASTRSARARTAGRTRRRPSRPRPPPLRRWST